MRARGFSDARPGKRLSLCKMLKGTHFYYDYIFKQSPLLMYNKT